MPLFLERKNLNISYIQQCISKHEIGKRLKICASSCRSKLAENPSTQRHRQIKTSVNFFFKIMKPVAKVSLAFNLYPVAMSFVLKKITVFVGQVDYQSIS